MSRLLTILARLNPTTQYLWILLFEPNTTHFIFFQWWHRSEKTQESSLTVNCFLVWLREIGRLSARSTNVWPATLVPPILFSVRIFRDSVNDCSFLSSATVAAAYDVNHVASPVVQMLASRCGFTAELLVATTSPVSWWLVTCRSAAACHSACCVGSNDLNTGTLALVFRIQLPV